ncbi:tautomerase family protein [Bradyrhizobium sp. WSM2793]|uniref:tautomerase family protein n=1 Tax=Bradyrhizobium sp. WSM2793 TaxID=1038866 RepID=UPI0003A3774B|nr:tautomerase family protein [Bradyrhizobium sp. WSM2793]
MPTYMCAVPPNLLSDEQKDRIALAIGRRHSEATGAPLYFAQVVIEENTSARRYLGGKLSDGHIWIRGDVRAGRSEEVRRALIVSIAQDVGAIAKIPQDSVWVYLCNLEPSDMVEYGRVLPLPGKEQEWFENLPASLQSYLKGLAANR